MDGPIVLAARRALVAEDVDVILPYVYKAGEDEVRRAFELAVKARTQGGAARDVADLYFFETAVRVHRAGEGAPYTGLKPGGLDVGPVIRLAEAAIEAGSADRLATYLAEAVRQETTERFDQMMAAKASADAGVEAARAYVAAMLGLQIWAHKLHGAIHAAIHESAPDELG
jgi:Family of unknown function (DUF6448)